MEFSEKWNEKSNEDKLEYLGKLCESQNSALDLMQQERNKWLEKTKFLETQLEHAEHAFSEQKIINHQLMTLQNADQQSSNKDIEKMVAYIEELGGNMKRLDN